MKHFFTKSVILALGLINLNLVYSMETSLSSTMIKRVELIEAAKAGKLEKVQKLLEAHVLVDCKDEEGKTPLYWASRNGHREIFELLLKSGANIKAETNDKFTPIAAAAQENRLDIVKRLIELGADVNSKCDNDQTVLMSASCDGHDEMVKLLLSHGARINDIMSNNQTALLMACHENHEKVVKILIDNGADVNIANSFGQSALIAVCQNGNKNIIELLLNNGADINASDNNNQSTLLYAMFSGNREIVDLLVKKGANYNGTDLTGNEYFKNAILGKNYEITKNLIKYGVDINATEEISTLGIIFKGIKDIILYKNLAMEFKKYFSPILIAIFTHNNKDIVKLLLDNGAEINNGIGKEKTPVITMARLIPAQSEEEIKSRNESIEVVINFSKNLKNELIKSIYENDYVKFKKIVLKFGSICIKDDEGNNVLHHALKTMNLEFAKLIFSIQPELMWQSNKRGETPLSYLNSNDKFTKFRSLILELAFKKDNSKKSNIFNLFSSSQNSQDALLNDIKNGKLEEVEKIIKSGIDLKECGSKALILAAIWGHKDIVKLLCLQKGANINSIDIEGNTALHYAANYQNKDVVGLLLDLGANKKRKNIYGEMPIDLANKNKNQEIIEMLLREKLDDLD